MQNIRGNDICIIFYNNILHYIHILYSNLISHTIYNLHFWSVRRALCCRCPAAADCPALLRATTRARALWGWGEQWVDFFFFEKPKVVKSVYSMDIHGISMVHLWSSMVYLCYIYGICMVCVWYMYGMCMGYGRCNGMECNGMEWDIYIYIHQYNIPVYLKMGYTGIRYTHHMAEFSESIGIGGCSPHFSDKPM